MIEYTVAILWSNTMKSLKFQDFTYCLLYENQYFK